ncbi:OmpA family protein [Hyphomonas pacifica]|uniref:OmpA family protein n=1 Tax=Hyphomonas pacifica TaxID=1280941 RepID=UPI000DC01F13|nr:OmpA family protein [Hyphomonas pacifica]RAN36593.1 hypothetical protein HY11_11650 [Hyphomonas pacifica]
MRLLDYLFGLVALIGLGVTSWWAVYQSPNTPVNLQARLQQNASAALEAGGFDWASVEMRGQRAVLHGQAPSADAVQAAAETVLTSNGAGGVIMGGVTIVESAVDAAPPVSPYIWRAIKTPEGSYVLTGYVPSRGTRLKLVEQATAQAAGASVEDRMQLAAGAPGANWQGMARMVLEDLGQLDTGEASLRDTRVRLSGLSMEGPIRARLTAEIANIVAPFKGEPLIRGPALWTAQHQPGVLILSGKVASEAEREEITGIARQYYGGEVRDEMQVAGEPHEGWMTGVRAGLPQFSRFTRGEMAFDPAETGFSVQGEASPSTLQYLQQDLSGLDGPYPVTVFADSVGMAVDEINGINFRADPLAACQQAFDAVMETSDVSFDPGTAAITRQSGPALDKLTRVAGLCAPGLEIEIGGHADATGDRDSVAGLSVDRAEAVKEYMVSTGFDAARLTVIGYGPDQPVQSNDTEEGLAKNRPISFKVRERSE